jgi:hypothetical protein
MITATPQKSALPPQVRSFLAAFVGRQRRRALLCAAGWAAAFAVAWLALACAADWLVQLGPGLRWTLLVANVAGILVVLAPPVARIFRKQIDWSAAAAQVEARGGHFGQRLQTITSQMLVDPAYRGSAQLLESILGDLGQDLRRRDAAALAPLRAAAWSWTAAVGLVILFGALAMLPWLQMPRLIARALEPWALFPPVTTTTLWVEPGNAEVIQGRELIISVRTARLGDDPPLLWLSDDGRTWQRQPMASESVDRFDLSLGPLQSDLQYFVQGGDARSDHYTVRVLRPPAVTQFRIHYEYPPYTAKPPLSVTNTDGLIEAPVGSTATLEVVCTEPLASATLIVASHPIPMSPTSQPGVRQCRIAIQRDQKLELQLLSGRKVAGGGPATMAIHALPDLPPIVKFVEPTEDLRLAERDTLPVTYLATDDYGVIWVDLGVQVNLSTAIRISMPLGGEPRYRHGTFPLDLSTLDVKAGDLVRLSLVAADNGGNVQGGGEERFILISPRGVDPATRIRLTELQRAVLLADALAANIETAAKALQEARGQAGGDVRDPAALSATRQNLAGAANAAAMLRQALLGSIARSDSPAVSTALARWADAAQVLAGAVDRASARLATPAQGALPQRLGPVANRARQMQQDLNTLAQGQLAAAVRAQFLDSQAQHTQQADAQDALVKVAGRLDQQLRQDAAKLALDPAAPDFSDHLSAMIARSAELASKQNPIDYARVADGWAKRLQQGQPPDSDMDARLSVGAEAESLRGDSNMVRARDLRLAAQAAPAMLSGPAAASRDEFSPALAAMQRDEQLQGPDAQPMDQAQSARIRADADAARAKMAAWAGIAPPSDPIVPAPDRQAMDLALQSNEQMARHDYSAAARTDRALAQAAATQPSAQVGRSMASAQTIDQIRREQDRLTAQTADADSHAVPQLAQRQQAVAQAIRQADDAGEEAHRAHDIAAIQAATTRLSELGEQLPQVQSAAAAHRQAAQKTQSAAKKLAATTQPADQLAAGATLAEARKNQVQADQRQAAAAKAVQPDVAQAISQSLSESSSHADDAAATIDRQLTPALRQLHQAMDASDAGATDRAVSTAAAAVAAAQDQLREARNASIQSDPLAAAQYFAGGAAKELSASDGDRAAAGTDQRYASGALTQAWQQAAHGAAMGRLAQLHSLAAILNPINPNAMDPSGAESATILSIDSLPAIRQWGQLQTRSLGSLSASVNESDPEGYQESLKAYFEALNQTGRPTEQR